MTDFCGKCGTPTDTGMNCPKGCQKQFPEHPQTVWMGKPCKHCGTITDRPNGFCSGYCQEVHRGLS